MSDRDSAHTDGNGGGAGTERRTGSGEGTAAGHGTAPRPGDAGPTAAHGGLPVPEHGLLLTYFLTVTDVAVSRRFYADVLGGEVVMEENPAIVKVANSWLIMNPGGGPTPDKPDVTLEVPRTTERVSSFLNVRVADMAAFHAHAVAKGARFLTEPLDRASEVRCYLRDPDGHLIEVGQSTGLLRGVLAAPPVAS